MTGISSKIKFKVSMNSVALLNLEKTCMMYLISGNGSNTARSNVRELCIVLSNKIHVNAQKSKSLKESFMVEQNAKARENIIRRQKALKNTFVSINLAKVLTLKTTAESILSSMYRNAKGVDYSGVEEVCNQTATIISDVKKLVGYEKRR